MIFTQIGVLAKEYTVVEGMSDFAHLVTATATPVQVLNKTASQLETFKHTNAPYVVYGLANGTGRADSEVTARTILFLDVDSNQTSYGNVMDNLTGGLLYQYSLVAYPTISNGIKDGARLRIGIELSRPAPPDDYIKVWRVVSDLLHVIADGAGVTKQFKQLAGTYVLTTQNEHNKPVINANDTVPLPVDEFVEVYDENPNKYLPKQTVDNGKPKRGNGGGLFAVADKAAGIERPQVRLPWYEALQIIVMPNDVWGNYGGWNNMLTSLYGKLLRVMSDEQAQDVVNYVNRLGDDPMAQQRVETIYKSINKAEGRK